jgi:hypothetical protein
MDWDFWKPIIAGQLRHGLTLAAGALVADGVIHSDQQGAFVQIGLAVLTYVAGAAWSWWQKTHPTTLADGTKIAPVASAQQAGGR